MTGSSMRALEKWHIRRPKFKCCDVFKFFRIDSREEEGCDDLVTLGLEKGSNQVESAHGRDGADLFTKSKTRNRRAVRYP